MHVCFISEEYPPETAWGGIGTYTFEAATGLVASGHRVDVVARTWGSPSVSCAEGVQIHRVPVPEPSWRRGTVWLTTRAFTNRDLLLWASRAAATARRVHDDDPIDVLEVPDYHAQGLGFVGRRRRPALIVRLHAPASWARAANELDGETPKLQPSSRNLPIDVTVAEWLEKVVARRAEAVTSPSSAMANQVARAWGVKPVVVPNPLDTARFREAAASADRDPMLVLFAGRLNRVKGVDVLIEAVPMILGRCRGARIRIVGADHPSGPGGTSMRDHLQRRAAELGIAEGLEWVELVPHERMPALYTQAAVTVVASRWDNFPYTCLEAMASGCAVVATTAGGIPEIVSDGRSGLLVPPGDPTALSEAVARLLEDPGLCSRLGTVARESTERRFAREPVCARLSSLYQSVSGY